MRGIAYDDIESVKRRAYAAFETLSKDGVMARGNHLCCGGCASGALGSALTRDRAKGKVWEGYAYWHEQDDDLEHGDSLWIGFGDEERGKVGLGQESRRKREARIAALARKIVTALQSQRLDVEWSGDINIRIQVFGIPGNRGDE